ncbi:MAG TPA: sigma-70 family RNA polymerase sigma factor [bacterium]|nr:sigma-70 family RNA polymerase sigma factor [bacterium]
MNREDFAGLYDAQYPRVFRYLLWRLRNRDAAEEMAAEVFATALAALQKGTTPRHVGSWLVGIADHVALRSWRRQRTERAVLPESLGTAQDPEELMLARLERDEIWRCVDALSPEHQQVILLRIVAGLSAREVGGLTGKTEEAVRSLQLRALHAFRVRWREAQANAGLRI